MRHCDVCGAPLVALLFTAVCERCEAPQSRSAPERGYIVWRARPAGSCEHVFRTPQSAERWAALLGHPQLTIRAVISPRPFIWRPHITAADIELADRLYEIFPTPDTPASATTWAYLEDP
jgi:hypothetical protein